MKPERLPGLDALRALAIVWVILFHAGTLSLGWPLGPVARFGWMGVDLFFVLSGFLIGAQWFEALLNRRAHFGAFYARRAYRIFPAYLVTLGLYAFIPATRERAQMQPLWQFFTFTENLLIDFSSSKTFSHVWSLCVEEHFYIVFPLLSLALFRGATLKRTIAFASLIVLGGLAWRAHVWFDDVSLRGDDQTQYFYQRIYYPTWTRLDGLVMGVLLAALKVFRPAWWKRLLERRAPVLTFGVLLSGVAIWLFQDAATTGAVLFGYPILSLALTCFVAVCAAPSMRAIPGAAFLAAISYSLYLTHKQALHLLKTWAGTTLAENDALAFGAYTLIVLVFGIALHFAIERPFLNLRSRRSPTVLSTAAPALDT
jgi:peptidoglycan/LPS O-acetylase OafA/YrhL